MKLIDTTTGLEAKIGQVYQGRTLLHAAPPKDIDVPAKCSVNGGRELFVSFLGLSWVEEPKPAKTRSRKKSAPSPEESQSPPAEPETPNDA